MEETPHTPEKLELLREIIEGGNVQTTADLQGRDIDCQILGYPIRPSLGEPLALFYA